MIDQLVSFCTSRFFQKVFFTQFLEVTDNSESNDLKKHLLVINTKRLVTFKARTNPSSGTKFLFLKEWESTFQRLAVNVASNIFRKR